MKSTGTSTLITMGKGEIKLFPDSAFIKVNVENTDQDCRIYVIWNKTIQSKNRDRVIFALENEYCTLKHGYCDYID